MCSAIAAVAKLIQLSVIYFCMLPLILAAGSADFSDLNKFELCERMWDCT